MLTCNVLVYKYVSCVCVEVSYSEIVFLLHKNAVNALILVQLLYSKL